MNLDYGRFLKVMALTTSDQDGEALAAIRTANRMLADARIEWKDVMMLVPRQPQQQARGFASQQYGSATENAHSSWYDGHDGDDLRAKQDEREAKYTQEPPPEHRGWTEYGPGGQRRWEPPDMGSTRQTHFYYVNPEQTAAEMSADIPDETEQINFYCFAVVEPMVARWLHATRDGGFINKVLYRQVLRNGDLGEIQKAVARSRARDWTVEQKARGNA